MRSSVLLHVLLFLVLLSLPNSAAINGPQRRGDRDPGYIPIVKVEQVDAVGGIFPAVQIRLTFKGTSTTYVDPDKGVAVQLFDSFEQLPVIPDTAQDGDAKKLLTTGRHPKVYFKPVSGTSQIVAWYDTTGMAGPYTILAVAVEKDGTVFLPTSMTGAANAIAGSVGIGAR